MTKNPKQTSKGVASKAGKQLASAKASKDQKAVAASDLSQAPYKNPPKKK